MNKGLFAVLLLSFSSILVSCGIPDTERYLDPVEPDSVFTTGSDDVYFWTPDESGGISRMKIDLNFQPSSIPTISTDDSDLSTFFKYYDLYYRIYISKNSSSYTRDDTGNFSNLNSTFSSDWNTLYKYTVESNYLTWGSISATTRANWKKISEKSGPFLLRSEDLNEPQPPYPDTNPHAYYFFNDSELRNSDYISNQNTDVVPLPNNESGDYTYVSIYVVRTDIDPTNLSTIYSCPTWLGVFLLPDTTILQTVSLDSITADGNNTTKTTTLTIKLSGNNVQDLKLITDDITIDVNGANLVINKGTLTGTNGQYVLSISSPNAAVDEYTITVKLSHPGYNITPPSLDDVKVYL